MASSNDIARIEGIIVRKQSNEQELKEKKLETIKMNAEKELFIKMEKISESVEEIKNDVKDSNYESSTDLLGLKPNLMGVGLKINAIIRKLLKKKLTYKVGLHIKINYLNIQIYRDIAFIRRERE